MKKNKKETGGGAEEVPCTIEVIDQFLTNISDVEIHGAHESDAIRRKIWILFYKVCNLVIYRNIEYINIIILLLFKFVFM